MKPLQLRWQSLGEGIGLTIAWFVALLASLSIHQLEMTQAYSVCGPWGCGPTNGALLTVHIGWLTALWPPLIYLPWRFGWDRVLCRWIGAIFASLGFAGLVVILAWQWIVWLPQAGEFSRSFIWQRCGFAVATAVDWPVVQLLGLGIVLIAKHRPVRINVSTL